MAVTINPRTGLATGGGGGGGGGGSAVTPGAPATGYNPAYGGVPQVPSLIDIYGKANAANQAMLPSFINTGGQITSANQQELLNNLRASIPGYDASVSESSKNIGALQRGEIPADVIAQLQQQGAERGISTGFYDSPNANAAIMRALGLTSLGLEGEGEKQMTSLVGRTPQAQPFDVSKLMMSPTDLYESQLLANTYAAAPNPAAASRQLISDQMAGYNAGRGGNVPSYSGGSGMPNLSTPPNIVRNDPSNPVALGALGPFPAAPTGGYRPVTGNLQAGGGQWIYDTNVGGYVNQQTGEISDTAGGTPWEGITWGGLNTPATFDDGGGDWTNFDEFLGGE